MNCILASDDQAIEHAVKALKAGGVITAPTETVYGLMALWQDSTAREEIYRLKHRPENKLLQMLISSINDLDGYALRNPDWIAAIASRFWPGPLTLVVEDMNGGTIGIRVPNHPFVLKLLQALGEPLAATSANLSGQPPASTPSDAVSGLDGEPALLVDGGVVTVTGGTASTVASIVGRKLTILRQGVITQEELASCLK